MAGIAGRKARAYRATIGTKVDATDALTDGAMYIVNAKGGTSALDSALPLGRPFIANGTITLATGDECYPVTWADDPFCILKDKSTSASKGTLEVTTDCEDLRSYISDELPSQTLSFSGNVPTDNDVYKEVESHFEPVVTGDGAGAYTVKDLTHDPMWFVLDYTSRGRASGDDIALKLIPVQFTGFSPNATMDGVQDFSIDGQDAGGVVIGDDTIYGGKVYDVEA